jgi:sodium/pantothenate symporter
MFVACGIALGPPLGISTKTAIIISGIVVLIFSTTGGMWGVVVTDTMMMFLFLAAALIGFPVALTHGGINNPAELVAVISEKLPGTFTARGYMPMFGKYFWSGNGFIGFIAMMIITSGGVGLTSSLTLSRVMICKNEKTVTRSFMLAQILLITLAFLIHTTAPFIKIAAPAEVRAPSGYIWMLTNWVPPVVTGIILAGIAAAGLSTASTLLQQTGASIGNDIIAKVFMKNLPPEQKDKKVLNVSRLVMAAVGVIMILICMVDASADFFVLYSWAFASGIFMCWLPAILIGAVSKKVTEPAAFWSTLISLVVYLVYWVFTLFNPALPHQIFIATPLCFIILFVVMKMRGPTDREIEGFWTMQSRQYRQVRGYTVVKG